MHRFSKQLVIVLCGLLFTGCGGSRYIDDSDGGPDQHPDLSQVNDAVPRDEPRSRYGNPNSYVVNGQRYDVLNSGKGFSDRGIASWYGTKFHGRRTSSGERYDMYSMTAAHKSLPLPTYVRVRNLKNQRTVIVKVNDRGPFHANRIIDLSYAAAHKLGITAAGTGLVEITSIDPAAPRETESTLASQQARQNISDKLAMFIQVGAFASRDNAERLLGKLLNASIGEARISKLAGTDATLYRVRIGPLDNVGEADRLARSLSQIGITTARVVID